MLKRWDTFSRFLQDGRICLTNNAAERALRGVALGRKAWLFAGSDRGGERAAAMYSLIITAKLNDVDPRAWLADVLRRIADHPASRLARVAALELADRQSKQRRRSLTNQSPRPSPDAYDLPDCSPSSWDEYDRRNRYRRFLLFPSASDNQRLRAEDHGFA